jgi:hypothetical protein
MDICDAIANRHVIRFSYDGHPRTVIPAAYGHHHTTGNEVLRGYQVGGTSSSRTVPLWDLFLIEKMVGYEVTGEQFVDNPPAFARGDKHISPLYCEL